MLNAQNLTLVVFGSYGILSPAETQFRACFLSITIWSERELQFLQARAVVEGNALLVAF